MRGMLKRIVTDRVIVAFILVVLLFVIGEFIVPGFIAFRHVMTVLQASFFLGLISLGQTLVVISGKEGLDLSVGGMFVIGIVTSAAIVQGSDSNLPLALIAVIATGFILGLVSGFGVSYLNIAPLIMTLAWGIALRGIALFTTKGVHYGKASPILETIGLGSVKVSFGSISVGIPWVVIIWIIIIGLVHFLMTRTRFGKVLYGIGANNRAAELSGIRTRFQRMLVYGYSGALSAIAGMIMLGYVGEPNINLGYTYVLPSAVAVIIGGISFGGGAGNYLGTVAGAIFLTTLESILATLQLGEGGRQVVIGIVLLLLLASYARGKRES
jgi:ribose transport system permease protein